VRWEVCLGEGNCARMNIKVRIGLIHTIYSNTMRFPCSKTSRRDVYDLYATTYMLVF